MSISWYEPFGFVGGITDKILRSSGGTTTTGGTTMLSVPAEPIQQMRIELPDGELIIDADSDAPDWLAPTAQVLADLLHLPSGWDSYAARPVTTSHVEAALQVLWSVIRRDTPAPTVVPTNQGGVQLEWHTGGIDLEIETLSKRRFLVSFEEAGTATEWERVIESDLSLIVDCIERLSNGVSRE